MLPTTHPKTSYSYVSINTYIILDVRVRRKEVCMSYKVLYIESHVLCLLLLGVLFFLNLKHWRPRYLNSLSGIYLLTALSSILDIAWVLLDGTDCCRTLFHIVNIVYLSGFEFIGFIWWDHCSAAFPFRMWRNNRQRFAYMLPAVIFTLLIASSPFTGLIYGIDGAGVYFRSSYFFIQPLGYGYLFASTLLCIRAAVHSKHTIEKKKFFSMAFFPLPSLFLGMLQIISPPGSLPTIQWSILIALLIVFIAFLENNVTQDSLTGLSNRYALDRALNVKMSNCKRNKNTDLFVLFGDLDKFKDINDTYGHMEGDRALKLAADTLKDLFHGTPTILARMGGDEFAVILETGSPEEAEATIQRIHAALAASSSREPYSLDMSLGMARYSGQRTAAEFLKEADHALYSVKRNRVK